MFIPINSWRHYIAREEMPEINYSHINGTILLVIYTILNCILYIATYYIPQEWNCRYVIFGISVFISILGIIFWTMEIKQFIRNNKNYERVCSMTQEEFKKHIEHPIDKFGIANVNSAKEAEWIFWRRLETSAIIARTLRLAFRYPDLAQEYLDSLPKATMD